MWMVLPILVGLAFAFARSAWEWNQLTGGSGNYPVNKLDDEPVKARPLFWCWFGFVWIIGVYLLAAPWL